MALVLFTWNPESYFVADRQWAREIKQIEDCGFLYSQWSCGNSIYLKPGDQAFLLRQGKDRRGIVASGVAISDVFEESHWDQENHEGETTKYCDITWTTQLPIDRRLTIEKLQEKLPLVHWSPFSSGTRIPEEAHTVVRGQRVAELSPGNKPGVRQRLFGLSASSSSQFNNH